MEERTPHSDELLKQLFLKGGGPHPSPRVRSMQSFMELDGIQYPTIDDAGYCLPQDLHQSNISEVGAYPLGNHHHCLTGTWRREFSSPEVRLYDGDKLLPVPWVRMFLPRRRAKLYPEVFNPHA